MEWEKIERDFNDTHDRLERMKVDGGWIYRNTVSIYFTPGRITRVPSICFVPDPAPPKPESEAIKETMIVPNCCCQEFAFPMDWVKNSDDKVRAKFKCCFCKMQVWAKY